MNIYLAGPIFTERDRMYLDYIYDRIQPIFSNADIYVPHRNKSINDKTKCATSYDIYWGDYNRLKNTDLLIAVISGDTPPIGTTCEIGIFTQMIDADPNKKMIVLYDDCREGYLTCQGEVGDQKLNSMRKEPGENQMSYVNIFLTGAIKTHGKLVCTSEELIKELSKDYSGIKDESTKKKVDYYYTLFDAKDIKLKYYVRYVDGSIEELSPEEGAKHDFEHLG